MEPSGDFRLAESFSIGLTCLDAATLSSSNNLYQKGNKLDYEELSRRLNNLREIGYSEILNLVIASLCEADSERRSSCSELYAWLEPYQEAIINLESFEATNLPQKIAQNSHFVQNQNVNQIQPQHQNFPQNFSIPNHGQQLDQGSQNYPQQNYIPLQGQDQRMTYTHSFQHQPQSQPQPQRVIINHPQQQQQFPPNVTYVQYPPNQYHPGPNLPVGQNVISNQFVYPNGAIRQQESFGDRPKTGMELTL